MQEIPIQKIPSQLVRCVLGGQDVQLTIYQKTQGVFVDVNSNSSPIVNGVISRDAVPLVCIAYTGFIGNIVWVDTQGGSDPDYTGFGDRFRLIYLTDAEYALIQ